MSGHTAGTWSVIKGTYGFDIAGPESERGRWLVGTTTGVSETDLANAHLIAAAPDLVEPWQAADAKDWDHLFRMLPESGHGKFWRDILTKHRAAIAKAEAQTSGGGGG